jgi:hypothetical protein
MVYEKRRYSRCGFPNIIVEYTLTSHIADTVSTGLLHDFSSTGLCVMTHDPLEEGQEIIIKSMLTHESIHAVVRWCCVTGNAVYKVGLALKKQEKL